MADLEQPRDVCDDPPPVIIELNAQEGSLASLLAHARNDRKEGHGIASKKASTERSEYETHLAGIGAEIAVAKFYNVYPDMGASLSGDDGYDLLIAGYRCEIKCRKREGWDFALMSDSPGSFLADVGILVYALGKQRFKIQGIISRDRLFREGVVRNYSHGDRWVVGPERFSHPSLLKQFPRRAN